MPTYLSLSDSSRWVALDESHARAMLKRRGVANPQLALLPAAQRVEVVESGDNLRELVWECRRRGRTTGLVPTMGALHAGHLSLVETCLARNELAIATIFVNPTQFGPNEDLDRYPRTLDADLAALEAAGAAYCFVPSVDEMYPAGCTTAVSPPEVARRWEGECRPGHFAGVATIVLKLFHLAPTDDAYFGLKDYQQLLVIRHMARDLNVPIAIHSCETVREPDGLALSSRNRYLSEGERQTALAVPTCLLAAQEAWTAGERDSRRLANCMETRLREGDVNDIDYAVVVDAQTLEPLEDVGEPRSAVAIVAARVGATRLIDNRVLSNLSTNADAD